MLKTCGRRLGVIYSAWTRRCCVRKILMSKCPSLLPLLSLLMTWPALADVALNANVANAPATSLLINEFMASNSRTLHDEDGDSSDWVEIYNPTATTVNLGGWFLTDTAANLT